MILYMVAHRRLNKQFERSETLQMHFCDMCNNLVSSISSLHNHHRSLQCHISVSDVCD
ncbi:hypothetical protein Leryth_014149 [Lithospermum erythrorhizon]|nr:hypothetical protein Leryth_014149 [Lithospermum erythrorhizon]